MIHVAYMVNKVYLNNWLRVLNNVIEYYMFKIVNMVKIDNLGNQHVLHGQGQHGFYDHHGQNGQKGNISQYHWHNHCCFNMLPQYMALSVLCVCYLCQKKC